MNPISSTVMIIHTDLKPTFSGTMDMWIVYFKTKKLFFSFWRIRSDKLHEKCQWIIIIKHTAVLFYYVLAVQKLVFLGDHMITSSILTHKGISNSVFYITLCHI